MATTKLGKKEIEQIRQGLLNIIQEADIYKTSGSGGRAPIGDLSAIQESIKDLMLKFGGKSNITVMFQTLLKEVTKQNLISKDNAKYVEDLYFEQRKVTGLDRKEAIRRDKLLKGIEKASREKSDALTRKTGIASYALQKDKTLGKVAGIYKQYRDSEQGRTKALVAATHGGILGLVPTLLKLTLFTFGEVGMILGLHLDKFLKDFKLFRTETKDTLAEEISDLIKGGFSPEETTKMLKVRGVNTDERVLKRLSKEVYTGYMKEMNKSFNEIASLLVSSKFNTDEGFKELIHRADDMGFYNPKMLESLNIQNEYAEKLRNILIDSMKLDKNISEDMANLLKETQFGNESSERQFERMNEREDKNGTDSIFDRFGLGKLGRMLSRITKGFAGLAPVVATLSGALMTAALAVGAFIIGVKLGEKLDEKVVTPFLKSLHDWLNPEETQARREFTEKNKEYSIRLDEAIKSGDKNKAAEIRKEWRAWDIEQKNKNPEILNKNRETIEEVIRSQKDYKKTIEKSKEKEKSIREKESKVETKPIIVSQNVPSDSRMNQLNGTVEDVLATFLAKGIFG